jgi:type I restriction enzyme S subunit
MTETKKLKDCCTIIAGQSPESKYYNSKGDGLPFFQGKADFGDLYPTIRVYCSKPTKISEKDDILLSVRAPVGPTNLAPCTVCIGRGLTAIRPSKELLIKYVLLFFRYFEAQLASKGTGTTFKAITQDVIKNLEIPVPSISEQQRIVSRIEELFSSLDNAVETLQKTKEQLAVYRQAVLKEAFEGDYKKVSLGDISTVISGYAFKSKKYDPDGKYVVVKIGNVKERRFDFSRDLTRTNEADDNILEKYLLQEGDCLITQTGSRGKRDYGFVSMISNQTNFLLNQRVAALRFNKDVAMPQFFQYYLSSPDYRDKFFSYETGNVGQGNVGIKALSEPMVILPSIVEQKLIIQNIEERLSMCDSIEKTVNTALTQAEAMRQSILKEAFEGRL